MFANNIPIYRNAHEKKIIALRIAKQRRRVIEKIASMIALSKNDEFFNDFLLSECNY